MLWDIFCRVVDNFGDAGVCWRLAADLAQRGEQVTLWIDNPSLLTWMAPGGAANVEVRPWDNDAPDLQPRDVVIEAFGCNPPEAFVKRMADRLRPPVWINFEYLSAENYVKQSHMLPSPQQAGHAAGLMKWFFYPGFTQGTGSLIREPDLGERYRRFDVDGWLADHHLKRQPGERIVSMFCYDNKAMRAMIDMLSEQPTLLLAAHGAASEQVGSELGALGRRGKLRAVALPLLTQADYDGLLWASDLNFVRGEDSFVRAQWAGRPFIWQIYPQSDDVHMAKLGAWLDLFTERAQPTLAQPLRELFALWNLQRVRTRLRPSLPAYSDWFALCQAWRDRLAAMTDLTTRLIGFVNEKRG